MLSSLTGVSGRGTGILQEHERHGCWKGARVQEELFNICWRKISARSFPGSWLYSCGSVCDIEETWETLIKTYLGSGFYSMGLSCVILCVVQLPSCVFTTPWIAACQASLSFTISQSLLKPVCIESMMPSNHLILCHPLLLPSVFPSIRVFFNESVLVT